MTKTVNSFAALGEVFGIKKKEPKDEIQKCPNCGEPMAKVVGNVYACQLSKLEDVEFKSKEIQVFSPCGGYTILET